MKKPALKKHVASCLLGLFTCVSSVGVLPLAAEARPTILSDVSTGYAPEGTIALAQSAAVPYLIAEALPNRLRIAQAPAVLSSPQVILNRLKEANKVPADIAPSITVTQSNTMNAATDGKSLMITSALLDRLTTDDERAFVISHELGHVLLQHIAKTQVRRVGLSLLDSLLVRRYTAQGSIAQLASELGIGLVDKRSSRTYEYQADDLGVKLMAQAGYRPQAALDVFDILRANTPANGTPEFLQDHPITDSRIRALVEKYKLTR